MSDSLSYIGDNIRHYRQVRGLTQEALAEQSGCARAKIVQLESGNVAGTKHSTVYGIAKALDVPTEWLCAVKRPELPTHVRWETVAPFEYDGCVWD